MLGPIPKPENVKNNRYIPPKDPTIFDTFTPDLKKYMRHIGQQRPSERNIDITWALERFPELRKEKAYDWFVERFFFEPDPEPLEMTQTFEQIRSQPQSTTTNIPMARGEEIPATISAPTGVMVEPDPSTIAGVRRERWREAAGEYGRFTAGAKLGLTKGLTLGWLKPPNAENLEEIKNTNVEMLTELGSLAIPWSAVGAGLRGLGAFKSMLVSPNAVSAALGRSLFAGTELATVQGLRRESYEPFLDPDNSISDAIFSFAKSRALEFALGGAFGAVLMKGQFKDERAKIYLKILEKLNGKYNLGLDIQFPARYRTIRRALRNISPEPGPLFDELGTGVALINERLANSDFGEYMSIRIGDLLRKDPELVGVPGNIAMRSIIKREASGELGLGLWETRTPDYQLAPMFLKEQISKAEWDKLSSPLKKHIMRGQLGVPVEPKMGMRVAQPILQETYISGGAEYPPVTTDQLLLPPPAGEYTSGPNVGVLVDRAYQKLDTSQDPHSIMAALGLKQQLAEKSATAVRGLRKPTPIGAYTREGERFGRAPSPAQQSAGAFDIGLSERDRLLKSPIGLQKYKKQFKRK